MGCERPAPSRTACHRTSRLKADIRPENYADVWLQGWQRPIRVAGNRDPEVTLAQSAKNFGIHVGILDKWVRQARIETGEQLGETKSESAELRELRKRDRLLEQRPRFCDARPRICLRLICREKALPARERARLGLDSNGGVVPGIEARSQHYRWLRNTVRFSGS